MDVVVAGYQDLGAAQRDFDVLCGLVKDKQVTTEYGVILVAKDPDGKVTLADTGDHLGRRGGGWVPGWAWWWACSRRRCWPRWW